MPGMLLVAFRGTNPNQYTIVSAANPLPVTGGGGGGGGAVTIADGADVTQGAKADTAWTGTGDASVVALLKPIALSALSTDPADTNLAEVAGAPVATGNGVAGPSVQRVAIASDNTKIPVTSPGPAATTGQIPNGQALSGAIAVSGALVALKTPAAWTAAFLTFDGSADGGVTYAPIYDDGVERAIASASIGATRWLPLDLNDWLAFTHIKLRSGTVGATVNQGANRDFQLAVAQ